jgi:hypothetical protein
MLLLLDREYWDAHLKPAKQLQSGQYPDYLFLYNFFRGSSKTTKTTNQQKSRTTVPQFKRNIFFKTMSGKLGQMFAFGILKLDRLLVITGYKKRHPARPYPEYWWYILWTEPHEVSSCVVYSVTKKNSRQWRCNFGEISKWSILLSIL